MDVDPGPIVQRILLGAELREARETRGLSTAAASKALDWYSGKLSKIEAGDMKTKDADLRRAVEVYEIDAERARRLQVLATDSRRRLPPARVPEWAAKYVHLVAAASELRIWSVDTFPGTVQTEAYARAMLTESVVVSPADVDRMAEDRARRAERWETDDSTALWLIVGEEALRREIGGPPVLREQLVRVRELAERPNITVQIVPYQSGAHSSHGLAFSLITIFPGRPGVVYVEGLTSSDYLGREHARSYGVAYDRLRAVANSRIASVAMLDQRISDLT
ncbi:helix-turn-helix domain-containing protein [Herbihabitans rhizosphaerae]|nr:Scr1 family TA system antitoxin-like transcriptional regulator [Herbihabitans rhizosphaerae]